jgi:S1-C subfamily serine protease
VGYTAELQAKIAERRPGDRVELTVYRDRVQRNVTVRLDEAPINDRPALTAERTAHAVDQLGLNVEALDAETAQELFNRPGGVIVRDVARGSPAARTGVSVRTMLVQVNDTEIWTPEDVRRALSTTEGGQVVSLHLLDERGQTRVVNVRMPE